MSRQEPKDFEYPAALRSVSSDSQQQNLYPAFAAGSLSYNHDRRAISTSTNYPPSAPRLLQDELTIGPNRSNASSTQMPALSTLSAFNHNHTLASVRPSTSSSSAVSPSPSVSAIYHTPPSDLDHSLLQTQAFQQATALLPASSANTSLSTLLWCDLEPWMDEEYGRQVSRMMGWKSVNIKIPHLPSDPTPTPGQLVPNNPGYCFLTFPSHAQAASVLNQFNAPGQPPFMMPNSTRPFVLKWAGSVPPMASSLGVASSTSLNQQAYQKEYSIFVGDLAPETSNSDLVAVFRNPMLGLRSDREPKFIRPFLSCKSAKIMLDPATGMSRGYGFVRFTDEADQQRALIEMQGLYCLSRPMRISPATAKHKGSGVSVAPYDAVNAQFIQNEPPNQGVTIALPLPSQTTSVSAPIAATPSSASLNSNAATTSTSGSSLGGSNSSASLSSNTSVTSAFGSATSAEDVLSIQQTALAQLARQYAGGDATGLLGAVPGLSMSAYDTQQLRQTIQAQQNDPAPRFQVTEESWRHSAHARHVLGNLIGPNGEQLTSNDPYNTTVFVGGLSPLISEDTLRTFFAPFGDIHYVKVPVGKHCGFVQFVRKADAERAIEKMQGFPIGGSRIRLSWGRAQYKAAQAAAQAAQATLQNQHAGGQSGSMTQQQALQLLEKFAMQTYQPDSGPALSPTQRAEAEAQLNYAAMIASGAISLGVPREEVNSSYDYPAFVSRPEVQRALSTFSPFSPDPSLAVVDARNRESAGPARSEGLPHPSKAYAPGFLPSQEAKRGCSPTGQSPTSSRPSSAMPSFGFADLTGDSLPLLNRAPGRAEAPISRPSSGPKSSPQKSEKLDLDVQDLNHTLANLDLRSTSSSHSGQFHLSTNT